MVERLPLFPLGTVLFPGMLLPLHLFEERYRRLMRERAGASPIFGMVLTRQGREVADEPLVHPVGTAAQLIGAGEYADGRFDVVVRGERRFRIGERDWSRGYLSADVTYVEPDSEPTDDDATTTLSRRVGSAYQAFVRAFEQTAKVKVPREELPTAAVDLAFAICMRLPLDTWERQSLLEEETTRGLLTRLGTTLRRERNLLIETGVGGATVERPGQRFTPN